MLCSTSQEQIWKADVGKATVAELNASTEFGRERGTKGGKEQSNSLADQPITYRLCAAEQRSNKEDVA